MTAPLRASRAPRLTRSPEPRRPLLWSIEGGWDLRGGWPPVFDWQCLLCESGTGVAPTYQLADEGAATHHRAAHANQGDAACL